MLVFPTQEYAIRELHFAYSSILGASIPLAIFGFGACLGGLRERKAPVWLHLVCGVLSLITFRAFSEDKSSILGKRCGEDH